MRQLPSLLPLDSNCNEALPLVHSEHAARFDGQGFELRGKVTLQLSKATALLYLLTLYEVCDDTWKLHGARLVCAGDEASLDLYSSAARWLDSCIPVLR